MSEIVPYRGQEEGRIVRRTEIPRGGAMSFSGARVPVSVREAALDDLAFIDGLQKKHSKMVGWMPRKQLEGHIEKGFVLIAEDGGGPGLSALSSGSEGGSADAPAQSAKPTAQSGTQPLGYCIARDAYMKREDCGIVYQLNVAPGSHRKLVGAALLKATFERAAYGCRLFCCWCAQDIEANYFWESMGFTPLAFRTGSRTRNKGEPRTHIFWQRRIREGDSETPWWFPSQTTGGALREGRIVLPIPPGTHWSDAKPAVLPELPANEEAEVLMLEESERKSQPRTRKTAKKPVAPPRPEHLHASGLWIATTPTPEEQAAEEDRPKLKKRVRKRNDPKYVAAARELRDRYLEEVNSGARLPPAACGKYDVSRQINPGMTPMALQDGSRSEAA